MNHRHRKVLHGIFAHPLQRDPLRWITLYPPFLRLIHVFDASIKDDRSLSRNLDPRAVEHVLEDLGAELSHTGHGALAVKIDNQQGSFHLGAGSVSGDEVMRLRKLLTDAGIEPERDYPL